MAGCFGNSDIDKWLERQVDEYNGQVDTAEDDDDLYGEDDD